MAKQGIIQLSAAAGTSGASILTEQFQGLATGISGGTSDSEVQVFKIAWGSTAEFYWADEQSSAGGTSNAGAGPLPIQLRDSSGNAFSSTAINGSSNRSLDVSLVNQGGSASRLFVHSNINEVGGVSMDNQSYFPIAGSTAGGAIPHIGATTDGYLVSPTGGTQGWEGTISEKLRTITSAIHLMKFGGTANDGSHYIRGLSADLRSIHTGVTFKAELSHGVTHGVVIEAIASGVTVGIGSVEIDNPVVIGHRVAGYTFERVNSTSTTLVSGVRLKNINGSGTLTVTYDSAAGSTTGMTSGFQLDDREELFVEVDNLTKVYVMCGLTAGCTFSYYAT